MFFCIISGIAVLGAAGSSEIMLDRTYYVCGVFLRLAEKMNIFIIGF